MSFVAVAATAFVASTGLQMYGQYQAGKAQEQAAKAQQQAADYNAAVARRRAEATEAVMESETSAAHKRARRLKAEQRAAYAASGALPSTGTPLLVMLEQAGETEQDIMTSRYNRMLEAQGYGSQAKMREWEGKMREWEGKQARKASHLQMGSTLLSSAGEMGMQFAGSGLGKSG